MSYPYTMAAVLDVISKEYAKLEPILIQNPDMINCKKLININHVLMMIKEIQDAEPKSLKAARWLGWLLRDMEERGFLTNEQSRALVRIDVQNGDE
jgi:hypothetical protein